MMGGSLSMGQQRLMKVFSRMLFIQSVASITVNMVQVMGFATQAVDVADGITGVAFA